MSRKDYIEAARIIRETAMPDEIRSELVGRFVSMFADDNPRFSPTKFREACTPVWSPPEEQECRDCGTVFPWEADRDYCFACAPVERYAPVAVFGGVLGTVWRVLDRETGEYIATIPPRFVARESAQASADNLNGAA